MPTEPVTNYLVGANSVSRFLFRRYEYAYSVFFSRGWAQERS
jgi:hypothetical protein